MPIYNAPTKDMDFILHDLLKVSEQQIPGYDEMERDFTSAVLEEAGKITSEVLAPLGHHSCDRRREDSGVAAVPAIQAILR